MGFNLTEITNQSLPINGSVDSHLKLGELVKRPFYYNQYQTELQGSATVTLNPFGVINMDGSNSSLSISVPSGLMSGAKVKIPFYGRAFGVRVQNDVNTLPFDVLIDGVSYTTNPKLSLSPNFGTDYECLLLIDDGLSDGLHYAELDFASPTTGTSSWTLLGLLLDSRAGYEHPKRLLYQVSAGAVPISDTVVWNSSIRTLNGIRKVIYANTTGSPIQVTVKNNSGGNIVWTKNIQGNDSIELDFGDVTTITTFMTHMAASAGINATVIGSVI